MSRTMTDVTVFLQDLDAGVYTEKVGRALSEVAHAVVNTTDSRKAKGKVTLTFDLSRMENSNQVMIAHKVEKARPTKTGKLTEDSTTHTPMYVDVNGNLTLFPSGQEQLFNREGEVNNVR